MYVGTQDAPRDDTEFEVRAQLGLNHICAGPPVPWRDQTVDVLSRFREKVESYGISLDMVMLPLGSRAATVNDAPHVFLAESPERDREIDEICELIRNLSRAGIPAVKYNITILGHLRTGPRYGRGGAKLSSFKYSDLDQSLSDVEGTPAPAEVVWERMTTSWSGSYRWPRSSGYDWHVIHRIPASRIASTGESPA